jgi:hypothetical protein
MAGLKSGSAQEIGWDAKSFTNQIIHHSIRSIPLTGAPFKRRIVVVWWERFAMGRRIPCGFLINTRRISLFLGFECSRPLQVVIS